MKRTAVFGAGTMLAAAALTTLPAAAQSQTPVEEQKVLLVAEDFTGDAIGDPNFHSLGFTCLTGETGDGPVAHCADEEEGPVPKAGKVPGFLQLTDAGKYHAGGVLYNKALSNRGGIEVTFAQYQYGGTGADGISFFIVDGETDLDEPGAFGGSLGYAQHTGGDGDEPGVEGGYLGLGLDTWGNFSADTEGRGAGCDGAHQAPEHLQIRGNLAPDNVALRGPGSGLVGYCLLTTSATDELVGGYAGGDHYGSGLPGPLGVESRSEAKRVVKLKITDDPEPEVTVFMDYLQGDGWEQVLETTVPFEAPETFKFGFAASTGGKTDVHLIRHLRVETFG